jgi:hypothetical protein
MTFLEIQSAMLEDNRQVSRNQPRNNILDQIKRSAGSTPAKSRRNNLNLNSHHHHMLDSEDTRNDIESLRHNDTEDGFAGFGNTPHADLEAYSFMTGDFSLFQASSSRTKDDFSAPYEKGQNDKLFHHSARMAVNVDNTTKPSSYNDSGPVQRMFRILDTQRTVSTEETMESSQFHSIESRSCSYDENSREGDGCGEPTSLLDDTDGDDDEEYTITGIGEGTDEESFYDSDEYEDDETLLSVDESKGPLNGVESFLDELAEVEGVQDLGTLLYQVGSCNFHVDVQTADDDFTVNSDVFPDVSENQQQRGRSTTPQEKQENEPYPPTVSATSSFLEGTTDTIAHILHSMSITTDSILEIMGSQSTPSEQNETSKNSNNDATTPNNTQSSFLQSMFSCHG